jgi:hypothetical protein
MSSYNPSEGVSMTINALTYKLIPGLDLLSTAEVDAFFQDEGNKKLKQSLETITKNGLTSNSSALAHLPTYSDPAFRRSMASQNKDRWINTMREELFKNPDFIPLKNLISKAILKKIFRESYFIECEVPNDLINTVYTEALYHSRYIQGKSFETAIKTWLNAFQLDATSAATKMKNDILTRQKQLIDATNEHIGFLLPACSTSIMESLLFSIGITLYYSDESADNKIAKLKEQFQRYLDEWGIRESEFLLSELNASLSSLLHKTLQSMGLQKTKEQVDRIANVHLLFGILGLREPSGAILEGLDVYNYLSFSEEVSHFKTVFLAMLKPVRSFFNEYVQISRIEKDRWTCILRAIMPILIMTCFVAFFFSLLVPFAMHAIIEIMMLIPVLYVSMVLASSYVDLKNMLAEKAIIYFYGSRYEHPDYLVNDRLLKGFENNQQIAAGVRGYYVFCFTECDKIKSPLAAKFQKGCLCEDESQLYEAMIHREALLKAEWFDIHDNYYLAVDKIKSIFYQRLNLDAAEARKNIVREGNVYIERLVNDMDQQLQKVETTQDSPEIQAPQRSARWSLFKPTDPTDFLAQKCKRQQEILRLTETTRLTVGGIC